MRLPILVFLTVLYGTAHAAGSIGQVAEVSGVVSAGPDTLTTGYKLLQGARVISNEDAETMLRMLDDSLVMLEESSDLMIEKFAFNPALGSAAANSASYVLNGGVVRMVPGTLARRNPSAVQLKTTYGDVISSGTDYTAGLCAAGCSDPQGLYVCVRSGQASVSADNKTTVIGTGQCASINEQTVSILDRTPAFLGSVVIGPLTASVDLESPGTQRLGQDAQEFLAGVIDTPASPSQPVASNAR